MKKALSYVAVVFALFLALGTATATPVTCDPPYDFACYATPGGCDRVNADYTCVDLAAVWFNNLPNCYGEVDNWWAFYVYFYGFSPYEASLIWGCRG